MKSLQRLYTTGCNIPIYVSGIKKIVAINPPSPNFKWQNFIDVDDVLGWPLKPSPSYDHLVIDIPVSAGGGMIGTIVKFWTPFS
ncbi:MAG: hypothetical protein ACU826_11990 [Gammaproteobacteria bacterium]